MAKKKRKGCCLGCFAALLLLGVGLFFLGQWALEPVPKGPSRYVRIPKKTPLESVLSRLQDEEIVRHGWAIQLYAMARRNTEPVGEGTYRLNPGMAASEILAAVRKPIRQMVRLPETNWAARSANLLERAQVCTAEDYMALVRQPQLFQDRVSFPLPKTGTLEGCLYPDTYDLPPLLGPEGVIERQLKAFEVKVLKGVQPPENLRKLLIVASLVELEVMKDEERPIVAGVIENRLAKGIPLQIDASLLYGIQKWRTLTFADYRNIPGPYNLYTHKGLPPGPICSPTAKSFEAAKNPAKHKYLYYVALPEGRHLFAETYDEHLKNIGKRKAALAKIEKAKAQ